jgi:hypothetical protein
MYLSSLSDEEGMQGMQLLHAMIVIDDQLDKLLKDILWACILVAFASDKIPLLWVVSTRQD